MRKRPRLRLTLMAAALAAVLFGCPFFQTSVSIKERIGLLVDDLNSADRGATYLNFHPTLTQDYEALKGYAWDSLFPEKGSEAAYEADITSDTDTSAVLVTISGGPAVYGGPKYYRLAMAVDSENEDDWRVRTLSEWAGLPPDWVERIK